MLSGGVNLQKVNQRLSRHWIWVGVLMVLFLMVFGNLARSLVSDTGGLAHVRKVGVTDAMAHTMGDRLMAGVQGHAPGPKAVRRDITFSVVHGLLLLVLFGLVRGRLDAIGRLKVLREEAELRT